jgi:hypothetical protein
MESSVGVILWVAQRFQRCDYQLVDSSGLHRVRENKLLTISVEQRHQC